MSEPSNATLPAGEPYRIIGPFNADTVPKGLRAEHRLKAGAWGLLRLAEGSLNFVWDDGSGRRDHLVAPAAAAIPPEVPHHLEGDGPFELTVEFYKGPAS